MSALPFDSAGDFTCTRYTSCTMRPSSRILPFFAKKSFTGSSRILRSTACVSVVPASDLNAHHVLAHDKLVLVDDAWTRLLARLPAQREEATAAAAGSEA